MSSSFLHALGLMSGTSGERLASFGPVLTVPYADDVRRLIRAAFGAEQPNDVTAAAEQAVTEAHLDAGRCWSQEPGTALSTVDVVGFHGQTVTHRPEKHFTWQIGDGAALAKALGVRVGNDLRVAA